MKNLHILPTDKPSRLCFRNYYFINKDNITEYSNIDFKNIYITSDEEIKEGDWYFKDGVVGKCDKYPDIINGYNVKKIILTTDQDLIADGVQAIDDEFLEWFVKNPKCEEVEVRQIFVPSSMTYGINTNPYKIIIPTEDPKTNLEKLPFPELVKEFAEYYKNVPLVEEPKQEYEYIGECKGNNGNGCFMDSPGHNCGCIVRKPKQETLEEVAKKYATNHGMMAYVFPEKEKSFIDGAEWQQERMYSEEDMLEFANWCRIQDNKYPNRVILIQQLFEKFKK